MTKRQAERSRLLSDSTRFVDGQVYRYSEIAERTFGPPSPPDSLWEYVAAEHGFAAAGPSDPLVDGQEASRAVAALRAAGVSYREIARRAGVAFDSVQRARGTACAVRHSTERALTGLAGELGR